MTPASKGAPSTRAPARRGSPTAGDQGREEIVPEHGWGSSDEASRSLQEEGNPRGEEVSAGQEGGSPREEVSAGQEGGAGHRGQEAGVGQEGPGGTRSTGSAHQEGRRTKKSAPSRRPGQEGAGGQARWPAKAAPPRRTRPRSRPHRPPRLRPPPSPRPSRAAGAAQDGALRQGHQVPRRGAPAPAGGAGHLPGAGARPCGPRRTRWPSSASRATSSSTRSRARGHGDRGP